MALRKNIWTSGDSLPSFTNWLNSNASNSSSFSIVSDYIQMSFTLTGGGNQYRYDDMSSISDYVIQSGDYLEFDIYWETAGAILQGVDFGLSDGNEFRDSGSVDQNSLSIHPGTDISAQCSGKWYHRKIPFTTFTGGSSVGKTVQKYALVSEFDSSGAIIARIKNIQITDGAPKSTTLLETLSVLDVLNKGITRTLVENQTFIDILSKIIVIQKILIETITFTDTFVKSITRTLSETIIFTDTIYKNINKILIETVNFLDTLGNFILNSIRAGIPKIIRGIKSDSPAGGISNDIIAGSIKTDSPEGIISDNKPEGSIGIEKPERR